MITPDSIHDPLNLTSVAMELFKSRSIHQGSSPHQLAIGCFRDATAFLKAAADVLSGELDLSDEDSNPLDPAFAPNLKKTHPINLMSRVWGDLSKVREVLAELDSNPAVVTYEPLSWGKPEVNQARALFPAIVQRSLQLSSKN